MENHPPNEAMQETPVSAPGENRAGKRGAQALIALMAALLLCQFCWRGEQSLQRKSPVWDEFIHMDYGLNFLLHGPTFSGRDHPYPAAAVLASPLLLTLSEEEIAAGRPIEVENPKNLLPSRRLNLGLAALSLALFSFWVARRFGLRVGLLTLAIGCFDPAWIAQARFVTTDIIHGSALVFGVITADTHARTKNRSMLALCAVSLAIACASKFSGLLLIPAALLVYSFHEQHRAPEKSLGARFRSALKSTAQIALPGLCLFALFFEMHALCTAVPFGEGTAHLASSINSFLEVRAEPRGTFLFGGYFPGGSTLYFPALLLAKTPLVILTLCAVGFLHKQTRALLFESRALWAAAGLFVVVALLSKVNLGFRHLTPVQPFLWLLCALVADQFAKRWRWAKTAAPALVLLLALETLTAHPNYLPFTNAAFGGEQAAHTLVVDSSTDWGQDLPALQHYLRTHDLEKSPVDFAYFGSADPRKFGINLRWRPCGRLGWPKPAGVAAAGCREGASVLALSATCLQGAAGGNVQDPCYDWLRKRKPDEVLGGSILIYRNISP